MDRKRLLAVFFVVVALVANAATVGSALAQESCLSVGRWFDPKTKTGITHDRLMADAAKRRVVLLGENHDDLAHHRWQLDVLAGLYALNPNMVIGFEAVPRRFQVEMDRWVAGGLSEADFLEAVDWSTTWGYPAEGYLPLFRFARRHRLPMLAINLDRDLVRKVGSEGWAAIPQEMRQGISDPAPATADYLTHLDEVFAKHTKEHEGEPTANADRDRRLRNFVDAQLLWDRAMAESLATASRGDGLPLVIGLMGSGHLEGKMGVSYQLADLGVVDVTVLLPVSADEDCPTLTPRTADALFALEPETPEQAAPTPETQPEREGSPSIEEPTEEMPVPAEQAEQVEQEQSSLDQPEGGFRESLRLAGRGESVDETKLARAMAEHRPADLA